MSESNRDYFNPLGIPDEISEETGTIEFNLESSNITDTSVNGILISDVQRGTSRFMLRSVKGLDLIFSHWNVNTGIREATVNLQGLDARKWLYVAFTWSKQGINLCVGDLHTPNLRCSKGVQREATVMLAKDGELCQVGGEGVHLSYVRIITDGEELLSSNAWQTWDLTLMKVNKLFEGFALSNDYFFKSTLAQQCLVMLVTGFEVYTRERFGEIERFKLKPADTEELLRAFDANNRHEPERNTFIANGGTKLESILEVPDERGIINFQNWDKCKKAYKKGYGIVFGKLLVKGEILGRLHDYFGYRHKIIHSKYEMNCLNSDKLAEEEPQYLYTETLKEGQRQLIERARDDFQEFIGALHEATTKIA